MKKNLLIFAGILLLPLFAAGQFTITGKVVADKSDEALAGATVRLKNTNYAVATDLDGSFTFTNLTKGGYTVKVSFVGYKTYEEQIELNSNKSMLIQLNQSDILTDEVIVSATRATENTPTTYIQIDGEELEKQNLGQDIPYLLNLTPSVVTTSDAGAGVGYTGLRIRGSDATRINVTINGIPLNDSESHGVFWVNTPDLASSVDNIQIQRGVGTSTNGAAAFGATVNIQTSKLNEEPYAEINNSYGSFNTWKHTIKAGSGLINDHFSFDARVSKLTSDGFIDRASSDLKSLYLTGGYYDKKTLVRANIITGKEKTYQAWWGTPEDKLKTDRTYNYYTYENETDNYQQDHYQLIVARDVLPDLTLNAALHYTYGRGYYEQFREDDDFADYPPFGFDQLDVNREIITTTDLIRRRWLDNDFYGFTYSADYQPNAKWNLVLGGGWNKYKGNHFGEIIWSQYALNSQIRDRYYDNDATKEDFNTFLKGFYQVTDKLNLFADVQYRHINYNYAGIDNDLRLLAGEHEFNFVNPKAGLTYQLNRQNRFYASYAIGNREPVRTDFIDAPAGRLPKHETLRNLEVGYERKGSTTSFMANYYLMDYKNQLVLTGELNDVGSSIRTNVESSYRTGIELQFGWRPVRFFEWQGNLTLSRNKIDSFNEVLQDYFSDRDQVEVSYNTYEGTDISFSPNVIGSNILTFRVKGLEASLLSKYVGKQYLDNTQTESRRLNDYFINDLRFIYSFKTSFMKEINVSLLVNNIFDVAYESNGYTYGYRVDGIAYYENFYYPQAGTNFLLGLNLKF